MLRHIEFSRYRLDEAFRLGPEAPFAIATIYNDLGIADVAEELHALSLDEAPEPWRSRSREYLAALLLNAERPVPALGLFVMDAADALEIEPSDNTGVPESIARDVQDLIDAGFAGLSVAEVVLLGEALYASRDFDLLAAYLASAEEVLADLEPTSVGAQEFALWDAVAGIELGDDSWPDLVMHLYRDYPAAHVHSRMWVFLINRSELLEAFEPSQIAFFRFRQLQSEGRADEAVTVALELGPERMLRSEWGLIELYRAGAASGRYSATAGVFETIATELEPELARRALEYAGRLYRLAGAYPPAITLLDRALALDPPDADRRRLQWYRLTAFIRGNPLAAAAQAGALTTQFDDPAYFADAFIELAGSLAERQAWGALLQAYQGIVEFATPGALARYEIAIARALELGVLPAAPARAEELRVRYLERAAAQRENLFAALLAATLLGEDGEIQLDLPAGSAATEATGQDSATAEENLASVYLSYGLLDELFDLLRSSGDAIRADLRLEAAQEYSRRGRVRESILVLPPSAGQTREVAELRYPTAYAAIVDRRTADEEIDREIFYALIREESLFDPEIASVVGATGLAQLMPATAEDIAGRMRMESFDVTDPADSLAIGARYFSMLTRQFGTYARALAAYNGGQGNVRSWERRAGFLDEVLFHQTIPFAETYNHVRKVAVSASFYAHLYTDRSPAQVLRSMFALE